MATASLNVKVGASIKGLQDEFNKANKSMGSFKSTVSKIGGVIAGAFAVQQIAAFSKEAFLLSETFKGVNSAFQRLPHSTMLMDDMKEATGNTVSELKLMQAAVKAQNFNIPLTKLAKFFEFATKRASETGESVDYLVESIITGIGRKSPLILDNLGISASQLSEEFQRTGDFGEAAGNIIERSLAKSETSLEDAAKATDNWSASWENFKTAVGNFLNSKEAQGAINFFAQMAQGAADFMKEFSGKEFAGTTQEQIGKYNEKLANLLKIQAALNPASETYAKDQKNLAEAINRTKQKIIELNMAMGGSEDGTGGGNAGQIGIIKKLEEELKTYKELAENAFDESTIAKYNVQIQKLEEELKRLRELGLGGGLNIQGPKMAEGIGAFGPDKSELQKTIDLFNQQKTALQGVASAYQMVKVSTEQAALSAQQFYDATGLVMISGEELTALFQESMSAAIQGFAMDLGNAAVGVGNFGDNILSAIGGFMASFGKALIASGLAGIAAKNLISNPYLAVAAGAALVAASQALKAKAQAAQKTLNGSGGGGGAAGPGPGGRFNEQAIARRDKESMELMATVKGTDLVFIMNKTQQNQGRTRG